MHLRPAVQPSIGGDGVETGRGGAHRLHGPCRRATTTRRDESCSRNPDSMSTPAGAVRPEPIAHTRNPPLGQPAIVFVGFTRLGGLDAGSR